MSNHFHKDGQPVKWRYGGKQAVLEAYVRLHDDKLIGEHWLWAALTRIALHKEEEEKVMADYGYVREAKRELTGEPT